MELVLATQRPESKREETRVIGRESEGQLGLISSGRAATSSCVALGQSSAVGLVLSWRQGEIERELREIEEIS